MSLAIFINAAARVRSAPEKEDHTIPASLSFKVVFRLCQGQAGHFGQCGDDGCGPLFACVQTAADGGAAQGERVELCRSILYPAEGASQLCGVSAEFLSQGYGCGVLQMRATDFYDIPEIRRFCGKGVSEFFQSRNKPVPCLQKQRDLHGGGEYIVAGLAAVDVVVGVYAVGLPELKGTRVGQ